MDRFDFYKDLYFKEIDRRVAIEDIISQLVTVASIIGGIQYFIFTEIKKHIYCINWSSAIFFISFMLFGIGVFFIAKFWSNPPKGYDYKYIPSSKELHDYEKSLIEYNKNSEENDEKISFDDFLLEKFIETTDANIKINDVRYLYLYRAKTFLIFSFVLCIVNVFSI